MKNGRGVFGNPANRFERLRCEEIEGDKDNVRTKFIEIEAKSIVNKVTSPDVGMDYSLNPYQGCEHGCSYCYARPTHEYWGYSSGVEFEQTVLVKKNASSVLRNTLNRKNWEVKPIVLSGNTDCYQPVERNLEITRSLLEVFLEYRHPVGIITKNALVLRDIDLLKELHALNLVAANVSITTLDESLRRALEPRTSTIQKRFEIVRQLSELGIPVNVMLAPVIPALNDHDILGVAEKAKESGASGFHAHIVRLMGANEQLFENWLEEYYPDRKEKVMNQIRELHNGRAGSSEFGMRGRGVGAFAENIRNQRNLALKRFFPEMKKYSLRTDLFRRPDDIQLDLF